MLTALGVSFTHAKVSKLVTWWFLALEKNEGILRMLTVDAISPILKKVVSHKTYFKQKKTRLYKNCIKFHTRRTKKAESPDWRRAYICPSDRIAGQMRNRFSGLPGDSLTKLENFIAKYVKQQYRCYEFCFYKCTITKNFQTKNRLASR